MATPVTPRAGTTSTVVTGGIAVSVVPSVPNGGYLVNPLYPQDQGLGSGPSEPLYVDPVSPPGSSLGDANNTTVALQPGQSYDLIPGQTTPVWVNAASNGHRFTIVFY